MTNPTSTSTLPLLQGLGPAKALDLFQAGLIRTPLDVFKLRAIDLMPPAPADDQGETKTSCDDGAGAGAGDVSSGGSGSITPTSITPVVAWRGRKHWGDRSVSNLLTAIDQRRTVPVARFLFGLGNRRHQRHNYSHITAILQS